MQVRPPALVAALVPVAACLAMDPAGWSPFGPAKWLAVSVLAWATVAAACGAGARLTVDRRLTALWAAVVALMALAAIGGLDPLYAWTGTPERHLGVFGWLTIGAVFVAGQQLRRTDCAAVAAGLVAAGWVVAAYALVEAVWRAPIRLATTSDRLGGPFGSPAFLGAACAVLIPVLVGVALDPALPRPLRSAAAPAAIGSTIALIGSGTRAAWLATAAIGPLVWAARRARRRAEMGTDPRPSAGCGGRASSNAVGSSARRVRPRAAVLLAGVAAAVGVAVLLGGQVGSALDRSHGAGSRVDEWRVAIRVIADHPVLGTGPEGYRLAVPGNVDADYERAYGRDVMPDRAHSGILDVAATGGVIAGLVYVALLGMLAARLWRAVRRGEPLLIGLAAGVGAYMLQQQLLFPVIELDPVVWLLAGAVVAWTPRFPADLGRAAPSVPTSPAPTPDGVEIGSGLRPAPRWQLGAGVVAGLLAVACLVAGVLDVAADRLDQRALDAIADGRDADALRLARRATDLRPDVLRYQLVRGRAEQMDGTLAGVDRWLAAVDDALEVSPLDPIVRQERGIALNRRAAITGTDADTAAALGYWQGLVAEDANYRRWQLELGRAAAARGDVALAREAWGAAAELGDPTAPTLLAALPAG